MKLILATNNKNKLREIREMLADVEVVSLNDVGINIDVEETGTTFEENAIIKARTIYDMLDEHCFVLADDSGLCVKALNNGPGIYSHRFAGEDATDEERINKLLEELSYHPGSDRTAYYECTMCLITPDNQTHTFDGKVYGSILHKCYGNNGFGYDPIFEYKGRTFAELTDEEKNTVSHRHNALVQVVDFLKTYKEE